MGLAALGEATRDQNRWIEPLSRVLQVSDGNYQVDPIYTHLGGHHYAYRFTDALVDLITKVDREATPVGYGEKTSVRGKSVNRYLQQRYIDLAWAAQELLEQAALSLVRRLVREHDVENLCIAGGVGLNCKMNGEILRRGGISNIFVQPASYDSGTALGAALCVAQQLGDNIMHPLDHVFTGPRFENDEIKQVLENSKMPFIEVDDPARAAAERLNNGQILGWFQGRMEFGARALGGRSILANPLDPGMKDRVNSEVKFRESWRPFCPSIQAGSEDRYLESSGEASHMVVAYHATEECNRHAPATVHVDGTIRPQVVHKSANPLFHSLLEELGKWTGIPSCSTPPSMSAGSRLCARRQMHCAAISLLVSTL